MHSAKFPHDLCVLSRFVCRVACLYVWHLLLNWLTFLWRKGGGRRWTEKWIRCQRKSHIAIPCVNSELEEHKSQKPSHVSGLRSQLLLPESSLEIAESLVLKLLCCCNHQTLPSLCCIYKWCYTHAPFKQKTNCPEKQNQNHRVDSEHPLHSTIRWPKTI